MKRLPIVFAILFGFNCFNCLNAQDKHAFKYRHEISVLSCGVATTNSLDSPLLEMEYPGFSQRIGNSRWRWGVSSGILGFIMDYEYYEEVTEDEFMGSSYVYLLGYTDYALTSGKHTAFFLRGGIAPCLQMDKWKLHGEWKASALAQLGIGLDVGRWGRVALIGFTSIYGELGYKITYSLGWRWGK